MKQRLLLLLLPLLMVQLGLSAQNITVKGNVVDAAGEPVIGASIVVVGNATVGVITDYNGNFVLEAPASAKELDVSYIGMVSKRVPITRGTTMKIVLDEDTKALDEVIVVGYGTQKKSDITGSVASVDKARLEKLPVSNVLQALQGATAGLTVTQSSSIPGEAPDFQIRAKNSINASSVPYVVVDGVPINKTGGSLADIVSSDIESIEILKDASATAIYGTNGANGVILITTKHGKSEAPKVKYSGYTGWETFTQKLPFCDGNQMIQRYKDYVAQNPGESMYSENVKYANEAENYAAGIQNDWVYDLASQTGTVTDQNVSVSGGSDKARYFISGDYMDQTGVLKGFNYQRYSLRTNIDVDVTDYLTIGTNTYIAAHNRDGGRVNFLNAEAMSPWGKVYEDDGAYTHYPMYSESLWANPLLGLTKDAERRQWNVSLNGFATVDFGKMWSPLQGLSYKFNAGYSFAPKRNAYYSGAGAYDENGTGEIFNSETQTYTLENILSYIRDWGKSHFEFTGLYAATNKKYLESDAKGVSFINDDLKFYSLGAAETASVSSYADLYTSLSQMARVNYSFDSRYLFTFTVRRDGSSVFGQDKKYGVFPSVALGWNIARESFMEPTKDWLNDLKLRVSYGMTGNEAISVYTTLVKMTTAKYAMGGSNVVGLYPDSQMGNNELSWETTRTFNFGLDAGLWNNRVTASMDIYKNNTNGLLLRRNLPKLSGYSSVYANMGSTEGNGIELSISSKNIVTRDFTWSTNFVFDHSRSIITDLYGDGKDDLGNRWFIGQPIGVIYDYDMVGIWQEDEIAAGKHLDWDPQAQPGDVKLADISGPDGVPDGKIDDNDRHVKGQTTPKWTAGLTNTLTYKGFTLSFFFQTVQGIMKNNSLLSTASDECGRRNMTTVVGYWTPENKSNEFRSLTKTSNKHNYGFAENASYTRLKDVTLSYTLPKNVVQACKLTDVLVYASGRNLLTWTQWTGWDPEARQIARGSSSSNSYGNSVSWEDNYPMTKSFTLGLNVTF